MTITEVLTDRTPHITLSRSDVEVIANYIWQHTRSSPNGRGYKVWRKMQDFIEGEVEKEVRELPLFDEGFRETHNATA